MVMATTADQDPRDLARSIRQALRSVICEPMTRRPRPPRNSEALSLSETLNHVVHTHTHQRTPVLATLITTTCMQSGAGAVPS